MPLGFALKLADINNQIADDNQKIAAKFGDFTKSDAEQIFSYQTESNGLYINFIYQNR